MYLAIGSVDSMSGSCAKLVMCSCFFNSATDFLGSSSCFGTYACFAMLMLKFAATNVSTDGAKWELSAQTWMRIRGCCVTMIASARRSSCVAELAATMSAVLILPRKTMMSRVPVSNLTHPTPSKAVSTLLAICSPLKDASKLVSSPLSASISDNVAMHLAVVAGILQFADRMSSQCHALVKAMEQSLISEAVQRLHGTYLRGGSLFQPMHDGFRLFLTTSMGWSTRDVDNVTQREILDAIAAQIGLQGFQLSGYLAQGAHGTVFSGHRKRSRARVIVKLELIHDVDKFDREVAYHRMFRSVLGRSAIRPISAFVAELPTGASLGVQVVEQASGLALDIMRADPELASDLASQLKEIVYRLRSRGMMHGDLHLGNIAYRTSTSGEHEIVLIDFGRSGVQLHDDATAMDADPFMVWTSTLLSSDICRSWRRALVSCNFPTSVRMQLLYGPKMPPPCILQTAEMQKTHYSTFVEDMRRHW